MKYQSIIGLEIHVQLNTKSKMFCSCSANYFGKESNKNVCPVCMGQPGALPVVNEEAIKKVLTTGLAFNCNINKLSKFDRKNYFYPDLPKGYQISQYDKPFCYDGFIEIIFDKTPKRIRIKRIHLEEDTAKTIYENGVNKIDFNKSGVPLMEIVTEPDFENIEETLVFSKKLKQILKYIEVSNCNMEKGQIRFELNVSLRRIGESGLPNYKVEIKNIGSISLLEKALNYEIERQSDLLSNGITPEQETRGLDDKSGKTISQRSKEDSKDYRYFPEPDIPAIKLSDKFIHEIKDKLELLPDQLALELVTKYKIDEQRSRTIVYSKQRYQIFINLIDNKNIKSLATKNNCLYDEISKWFVGTILYICNKHNLKLKDVRLNPDEFASILEFLLQKKISGTIFKAAIEESILEDISPIDIVNKKNLLQISDVEELKVIVERILKENPKIQKDLLKNPNSKQFIIGMVMRETKGKANPQVLNSLIDELT